MHLEEQINRFSSLDNWFKTPQGMRVAHAFSHELLLIKARLTGDKLIQLGHCGNNEWLSLLKYRHKWIVSPDKRLETASLCASYQYLPIDRDSIDCILLPMTLEAFPSNKNPLDEIDRILKPMGHAIFLGINPWSFWGMLFCLKRLGIFGGAGGSLTSALKLQHMMFNRGYRQCHLTSFYYIPPVSSAFFIDSFSFLNEMGKMIWPYPAAFYCLVVQKCSASLTPLRSKVSIKKVMITEPAAWPSVS